MASALTALAPAQAWSSFQDPRPEVIGGSPAASAEWPSIAALIVSSQPNARQGQFCGGTLISARWVLTAAHCLFDEDGKAIGASDIDVAVGAVNLSGITAGQRIRVSRVASNPGFVPNSGYSNDVALLGLSRASDQPSMQVVAPADGLAAAGRPAKVAGWGCTVAPVPAGSQCPAASSPEILQQAGITVQADDECSAAFGSSFVADQMICAGAGSPNACVGDSGGPLTIAGPSGQPVLVGAVSFGDANCAGALDRGVYTRLSAFRSWIAGTIASDPPAPDPSPTPTPAPTPPARPTGKVIAKGKTVTASITPQAGVAYSIAARTNASKPKVVRGRCRTNTRTRRVDCTVKLSKGKWTVSVTPTRDGVTGAALIRAVRVR